MPASAGAVAAAPIAFPDTIPNAFVLAFAPVDHRNGNAITTAAVGINRRHDDAEEEGFRRQQADQRRSQHDVLLATTSWFRMTFR